MAVRLSALHTGRVLLSRNISTSGTHFCYWMSKPQGLVRPEGLVNLKNSFTSLGLKTETFRLLA
jgi:hypothetical protein